MNWPADCAVIIPCLNESAAIGMLVAAIRRQLPRVLVIDDGSTDGTGDLAMKAGAEVLRHPASLGKGAALNSGWNCAREKGFTWALTLDGDGQHSPEDIPRFLKCAEETSAQLVIGNRMHDATKMPWLRRHVNRWMSARISRRAGCELPDSQCGFRLMNLSAMPSQPASSMHFEIESDVLLSFARAGRKIEFVPIQVIYKSEQSKIHPFVDTLRWFHWWRKTK